MLAVYPGRWFLTSDRGTQEHALLSRVARAVLVIWAALDFRKVRRWAREDAAAVLAAEGGEG